MKNLKTALLIAALFAAPFTPNIAHAQTLNCEDTSNMTQNDMNVCANQDYQTADRALNIVWPKVKDFMQSIADLNKENMPDEPDAGAKLLEAQRAWLTYRDAQCASEAAQFAGGSIQPLIIYSCLASFTRKRTEELVLMMETN